MSTDSESSPPPPPPPTPPPWTTARGSAHSAAPDRQARRRVRRASGGGGRVRGLEGPRRRGRQRAMGLEGWGASDVGRSCFLPGRADTRFFRVPRRLHPSNLLPPCLPVAFPPSLPCCLHPSPPPRACLAGPSVCVMKDTELVSHTCQQNSIASRVPYLSSRTGPSAGLRREPRIASRVRIYLSCPHLSRSQLRRS